MAKTALYGGTNPKISYLYHWHQNPLDLVCGRYMARRLFFLIVSSISMRCGLFRNKPTQNAQFWRTTFFFIDWIEIIKCDLFTAAKKQLFINNLTPKSKTRTDTESFREAGWKRPCVLRSAGLPSSFGFMAGLYGYTSLFGISSRLLTGWVFSSNLGKTICRAGSRGGVVDESSLR